MSHEFDLARGLVRKAESDLQNVRLCLSSGMALDTACFHAQQAAEKYMKAYLICRGVDFPFIHNVEKLVEEAAKIDPEFADLTALGSELTPYAVDLRYDEEFWPDSVTAAGANEAALRFREFIRARLPESVVENS